MLCKSGLPALQSSAATRNCLDHDMHLCCQELHVNGESYSLISCKLVDASVTGELGPKLSWQHDQCTACKSTGLASDELT